jgi:hypothetical protein
MPFISGHRPKVLIARKGAQAKWQGVVLPHAARSAVECATPRDGVRHLLKEGEGDHAPVGRS